MSHPHGRLPSRISNNRSKPVPLGSRLALVQLVSIRGFQKHSISNSHRAFGSTGAFGQTSQQQPQANPMFGNLGGTPNTTTTNTGFGMSQTGVFHPSNMIRLVILQVLLVEQPTHLRLAPRTPCSVQRNLPRALARLEVEVAAHLEVEVVLDKALLPQEPQVHQREYLDSLLQRILLGRLELRTTRLGKPRHHSEPRKVILHYLTMFHQLNARFTAGTQGTTAVVTTGSSNPPYSVFTEKDPAVNSSVTLQYQAISCMPAYAGTSHEVCTSRIIFRPFFNSYFPGITMAGLFAGP